MNKGFILSIDQGTTSTRCILFDQNAEIISSSQQEIKSFFPREGWVEQDPMEIYSSVRETFLECIEKSSVSVNQITAIGIANQRETTLVWDRKSGIPIYPAIVWQSKQSLQIIEEWKRSGFEPLIIEKTGLVADAYFSAGKLAWILNHVPDARVKAEHGELAFGTVDSWLLWMMTAGKVHATDYSNAARTSLFNIHTRTWDEELLNLFNIPKSVLPEVKDSSGMFGFTAPSFCEHPIPICGIAGDQQAALFGQGCFEVGMAKNTYGTGCFMLMNTGSKPVRSRHGLLTTIAWGLNGQITYALEGSVFIAGSAVKWLRDQLNLIQTADETEELAASIPSAEGVYFVPAFIGLGTPHWNADVRGSFFGLSQSTNRKHLIRSALEAMAYQTRDVFETMELDSGIPLSLLRVDGGASKNNLVMQFQSDILNLKIDRPLISETTALGAAMLAGLACGLWKDEEACLQLRKTEKFFRPEISESERQQLYTGWKKAVNATISFHS